MSGLSALGTETRSYDRRDDRRASEKVLTLLRQATEFKGAEKTGS
jgi:hypothetical protein